MYKRTADSLDQIAILSRSLDERLATSAASKRLTDQLIRTSRHAIDDSRRLLASLKVNSGVAADKQRS